LNWGFTCHSFFINLCKGSTGDSISWDLPNQKWIKQTEEFFGNNSSRIIEQKNIENFSENSGNKGKINLSLDLRKLNFPSKYFIVFSASDFAIVKGNVCILTDFINRFLLIPPDFGINTFPSQLEIRQGEEKNFLLNLNSTKFVDAIVDLNPIPPRGFNIDFAPNPFNVSRTGIATSQLKMKVSDGVRPGPYRFPVKSSISLPGTIDFSKVFQSAIQSIYNFTHLSTEGKNGAAANLTINNINNLNSTLSLQPFYITAVVAPYSWWREGFSDFWDIYGDFLSLLGGGFAAGFSALLIDRFKKKPKN
jgi:hypothetical protein